MNINAALIQGLRGLPGGSSLAKLLAERRGKRNVGALPPLTESMVLEWADLHFARHGAWPDRNTGPIDSRPGETWHNINAALHRGGRGLPAGRPTAWPAGSAQPRQRAASFHGANPCLGRRPPSADGQVAEVPIGACGRRAGRDLAGDRAGIARRSTRITRGFDPGQAAGGAPRSTQPQRSGPADAEEYPGMGRCAFQKDRQLAVPRHRPHRRGARRYMAGGRSGAPERRARLARPNDIGPFARPASGRSAPAPHLAEEAASVCRRVIRGWAHRPFFGSLGHPTSAIAPRPPSAARRATRCR